MKYERTVQNGVMQKLKNKEGFKKTAIFTKKETEFGKRCVAKRENEGSVGEQIGMSNYSQKKREGEL